MAVQYMPPGVSSQERRLPARVVLLQGYDAEWNAEYRDGRLVAQGHPDRVNTETLYRTWKSLGVQVEYYGVSREVYDRHFESVGYPSELEKVPLGELERYR